MKLKRVCLVPKMSGVGGMVSFQAKLAGGLAERGIETSFDLADQPYQAVLVIGGTRSLAGLWRARRGDIPVVQRLNGMNWLHRLRHRLATLPLNTATCSYPSSAGWRPIVYQSIFHQWWERRYGKTRTPWSVVYNGVDLSAYSPNGTHNRPEGLWRILLVEGSLGGGYESGLETAVQMAEKMADHGQLLKFKWLGELQLRCKLPGRDGRASR
jgi:hypothetical protein